MPSLGLWEDGHPDPLLPPPSLWGQEGAQDSQSLGQLAWTWGHVHLGLVLPNQRLRCQAGQRVSRWQVQCDRHDLLHERWPFRDIRTVCGMADYANVRPRWEARKDDDHGERPPPAFGQHLPPAWPGERVWGSGDESLAGPEWSERLTTSPPLSQEEAAQRGGICSEANARVWLCRLW